MTDQQILEIALANGLKLKERPDGSTALNPYVFDFARAVLKDSQAEIDVLKAELLRLRKSGLKIIEDHAHRTEEAIQIRSERNYEGGGMNIPDQRDEFEKWAADNARILQMRGAETDQRYGAWLGWQAALAAASTPPAPEVAIPDDFIGSVRRLVFVARTSGGTAGRDRDLCAALSRVEAMLEAIYDPDWQKGMRQGVAPEVESVLWIDSDNFKAALALKEKGALRYIMCVPEREADIPLYTHPANDGLRKAAEEAARDLILWAGMTNTVPEWLREKLYDHATNLRAELEKLDV